MVKNCELCGDRKSSCEKDIRVYFCPKCKSHNVRYVFGFGNIFGVLPKMKCFDCNYSSPSFPVLVTNSKKIKKASDLRNKKSKRRKK